MLETVITAFAHSGSPLPPPLEALLHERFCAASDAVHQASWEWSPETEVRSFPPRLARCRLEDLMGLAAAGAASAGGAEPESLPAR